MDFLSFETNTHVDIVTVSFFEVTSRSISSFLDLLGTRGDRDTATIKFGARGRCSLAAPTFILRFHHRSTGKCNPRSTAFGTQGYIPTGFRMGRWCHQHWLMLGLWTAVADVTFPTLRSYNIPEVTVLEVIEPRMSVYLVWKVGMYPPIYNLPTIPEQNGSHRSRTVLAGV